MNAFFNGSHDEKLQIYNSKQRICKNLRSDLGVCIYEHYTCIC